MKNSSTEERREKIPGPFEWKRLVRDTKGGPNPICLFRSGPTTANFHTDYISIDHYKLLLSASFHPQECSGMENFREESLKIKKFPSQTSQPPHFRARRGRGWRSFSGLQDKLFLPPLEWRDFLTDFFTCCRGRAETKEKKIKKAYDRKSCKRHLAGENFNKIWKNS